MQQQPQFQILEQQQLIASRRPTIRGDRGRGGGAQVSNTGNSAGANVWVNESAVTWTDGSNNWTSS